MRTILKAEDLVKIYRIGKVDVHALRGVSLEVEEGEFLAIMGPSGCGKSTMLHLLGGLLTPTSGRIVIDGDDITAASDAKRTAVRRKKIGFVFQRFNLFPTLTAEGNLRLAERIHGNGGGNAQLRRDVLRLLGLEDKLHHKPLELSGGEQQRVALARAVVTRPAIVLADEPTGNLDSENSALVLNMFQELNYRFNQTIIMITHNPEAAAMCRRISFTCGCVGVRIYSPASHASRCCLLASWKRARPFNHTEEDLLLELREKHLAMGSALCGHFDLHIFDAKKVVYEWRTGP
jgi:putative ABC transport system ATP-binding protein